LLSAVPEARRKLIEAHVAKHPGYVITWPKPSWTTLRLADADTAGESAPAWMILCNAHGTAKAIPGSRSPRVRHLHRHCVAGGFLDVSGVVGHTVKDPTRRTPGGAIHHLRQSARA
jgi:hypothetical protein